MVGVDLPVLNQSARCQAQLFALIESPHRVSCGVLFVDAAGAGESSAHSDEGFERGHLLAAIG
ncbi:MAG: hypothetical protein CL912_21310 [Deltaproteobacteria bacterium]|nr:hypothetical protein [Deltaproteobacteria bacterium]